jgi:tetratricopeptide (TPR) repeat protein
MANIVQSKATRAGNVSSIRDMKCTSCKATFQISLIGCILFLLHVFAAAADDMSAGKRAYAAHDLVAAETHFKNALKSNPNDVHGQMWLGHALYYQQRYKQAIPAYEKARELDSATRQLSLTERRVVNDNLGISYALGKNMPTAQRYYLAVIRDDPAYPLYYYNLAGVYAEMNDLDTAVSYLLKAWDRRANGLEGEGFPDPRQDSSFNKYLRDPRFNRALDKMGYSHR